ncbi:hypothetical protein GF380_05945 [Candidatus Uhrbacteria bacterium]|nr:hypothetical protein [Candidatus Uhrbacteria bacterium]MBD3284528.1 hypothetical protein [Candidatus Uhrbacteria bacterium]
MNVICVVHHGLGVLSKNGEQLQQLTSQSKIQLDKAVQEILRRYPGERYSLSCSSIPEAQVSMRFLSVQLKDAAPGVILGSLDPQNTEFSLALLDLIHDQKKWNGVRIWVSSFHHLAYAWNLTAAQTSKLRYYASPRVGPLIYPHGAMVLIDCVEETTELFMPPDEHDVESDPGPA